VFLFQNERLEFIILLPRDRNGLEWPLEAKLKDASLASILARMKKRNVNVFIPKFEMES
jgi:serine protease inhibitor